MRPRARPGTGRRSEANGKDRRRPRRLARRHAPVAERRADQITAAMDVEHRRPVNDARGDDAATARRRGRRPRDRCRPGARTGVQRLERGPHLEAGRRRSGEHASKWLQRPREPRKQLATDDSAAATASSTSRSSWRARSSRASPASVSSTLMGRAPSAARTPRSCSRPRIVPEGCDIQPLGGAAEVRSSATATNARRWRSSMPSGAWGKGRTLAG